VNILSYRLSVKQSPTSSNVDKEEEDVDGIHYQAMNGEDTRQKN
jgi:hypothetical protein